MTVLGIIAEFNPFHNGHKYLIDKAKELISPDLTICAMSGNFVQRGAPAIFNKWVRAKESVKNGVDVVFELPAKFVLSSAESFAYGGISLLNDLGVTHLAFGCENSLDELQCLLKKYDEFEANIQKYLESSDNNFIIAKNIFYDNNEILKKPNNILAFEYLKAIKKLNSKIIPIAIKRIAVEHNSTVTTKMYASASKIRELIINKKEYENYIPNDAERDFITTSNDFSKIINYKIMLSSPEKISKISGIREGLENKIHKNAFLNLPCDELIMSIKSKRYTHTAISRMIFSILLDVHSLNPNEKPLYARLLALNSKSSGLLKQQKNTFKIPFITKATEIYNEKQDVISQAELDFLSSDIYFSIQNSAKTGRIDFITSPQILNL